MVGPWGHGVAGRAPLDHQLFDGGGVLLFPPKGWSAKDPE